MPKAGVLSRDSRRCEPDRGPTCADYNEDTEELPGLEASGRPHIHETPVSVLPP